jgi:LuxR family maltose regulon positive regulatory protein
MGRFRRSKSPRAAVLAPVLESKLTAPGVRPGHVARQRLVSRLSGFVPQKLTVLAAPAGFGKTTLLAEWFENEPRGSVAWVTLDEHDDDPLRFWSHVVEALRRIAPDVNAALRKGALGETLDSDELVPRLLNVLARVQRPISLVLDDYHVIASERIHESLSQLVHHIPPHVCVVVATRRDPPLPLGRLRAAGDLGELRASDLRFDLAEARALLTESLGLELGDEDVEYLHVKAEGWPAALYLAGLSLRDQSDPHELVVRFAGSNRHIADYVSAEVLAAADAGTRDFLLRTSVLGRLSGPLGDYVLHSEGSADRLRELERSNLFVVALDDDRVWYRYHPLLRELLRFELHEQSPEAVTVLHARASAWLEEHGELEEAVGHGIASGDASLAAALICRHWREVLGRRGRVAAVREWLVALPAPAVAAEPSLSLLRAFAEIALGSPADAVEPWLTAAEEHLPGEGDPRLALPFGSDSPRVEAEVLRALMGSADVGAGLEAARAAVVRAASAAPPLRALAGTVFGYWLLLAGREHEALPVAKEALHAPSSPSVPLLWAFQHAVASLAAAGLGDEAVAAAFARRGVEIVEQSRHAETPRAALVWIAHGAVCARRGSRQAAETALGRAVALTAGAALALDRALALILLASALRTHDDARAEQAFEEARELVDAAADPGVLAGLLASSDPRPARRRGHEAVSDAELRVLRLLPTRLTQREIGRELYLSFNTVKTHTRSLYRKLSVDSRRDAVARARELRLI